MGHFKIHPFYVVFINKGLWLTQFMNHTSTYKVHESSYLFFAPLYRLSLFILDVIKYCDHPRWYEKIPPGGGTSNWRWDLQLEVTPPIRGDTSNWRWHLQSEVGPPIGGEISNWRSHLQLEVPPPGGIFSYHLGWSQYLITSRINRLSLYRGAKNR